MPNNRNSSGPSKGRRSSSPRSGSAGRSFTKKSTDKPFKKSSGPDKKFGKPSSEDSFSRGKKFSGPPRSSDKPFKRSDKDSDRPSSFDKRPGSFQKKRNFSGDSPDQRPQRRYDDKKETGSGFRRGGSSSFEEKRSFSSGPKPFKKFDGPKGRSSFNKEDGKPAFKKRDSFSDDTRPRKKFDGGEGEKSSFKRSDKPGFTRSSAKETKRPYHKSEGPTRNSSFNKEEGKPAFKKRASSSDDTRRPRKKFDGGEDEKSSFKRPDKPGFTRGSTSKDSPRPYKKAGEEIEKRPFDKSEVKYSRSKNTSEDAQPSVEQSASAGKIRLNKYIANSGVCSRREADELIKMGLISVNGKTITELGYKVNPGDEVRHESKVLKAEKPVYILMNKPKGYLTTTVDPQERNTVMNLIGGLVKERIYPVGRLDRNTTGLLLLTNDGDLAEKLMHPSYNIKKIYKVDLDKPLTKADADRILEGVRLEEGKAIVDDLAIVSDDRKTIGLEIHIGWNRVVRRIFESLEYSVVKLDRSVYAGLTKKDLSRGEWRFLKKEELVLLKHFK